MLKCAFFLLIQKMAVFYLKKVRLAPNPYFAFATVPDVTVGLQKAWAVLSDGVCFLMRATLPAFESDFHFLLQRLVFCEFHQSNSVPLPIRFS